MFNGSNTTNSGKSRNYTGMTVFNVLALNPSKEEIEAMLGKEYKLNVNYDAFDLNGKMLRPVEIWVKDVAGYMDPTPMRFLVGLMDDVASTGAIRFVNTKGVFTYGKSEEALRDNPKMEWFTKNPFRPAKAGEYELFTFLQKLMRYNNYSDDANFMADAEARGVTIENIYNNNLTGLREVFDWCNSNENKIVLIAAVRSTSKLVEGNPVIYYNQTIVSNPQFFYTTSTEEVGSASINNLKAEIDKGSRVSKYLFTIGFQPFVKEECINLAPDAVVSATFNPTNLL